MMYNISYKIKHYIFSASNTKSNHTPIQNGGIIYNHTNSSTTLDAYISVIFFCFKC